MTEAAADQVFQRSVLRRASVPGVNGPLVGALLADARARRLSLGG